MDSSSIGISQSDIQDAKALVDLHAVRLQKLQELCEIEHEIKALDISRSEWVKICSGSKENIVKKQSNKSDSKSEKHKPLSKIIVDILKDNPAGLLLDDIIKIAISQSSKTSKNFSSTCRQYVYNLKKVDVVRRNDSTFKYSLTTGNDCSVASMQKDE
jgi:hypothetical protein